MRFQGKIKSWNQAKGFGFITPNGGGNDVFLHNSEFSKTIKKSLVNKLVTYEIELDDTKRQRAVNVKFVGEKIEIEKKQSLMSIFRLILIFGFILFAISDLFQHRGSTIESTFYKSIYLRDYKNTDFVCDGKTHCSEMSSCKEALFYQESCSGTEMDGDRDGIPCEQQWCN